MSYRPEVISPTCVKESRSEIAFSILFAFIPNASRALLRHVCFNRSYWPDVIVALQAVELRDRFYLVHTCLADVPNFDTAFTTGINVLGRIRDRHCTDYFAVIEGTNLARDARYSWTHKSVLRERHWLHLPVAQHMVAVRTAKSRPVTITISDLSRSPVSICMFSNFISTTRFTFNWLILYAIRFWKKLVSDF